MQILTSQITNSTYRKLAIAAVISAAAITVGATIVDGSSDVSLDASPLPVQSTNITISLSNSVPALVDQGASFQVWQRVTVATNVEGKIFTRTNRTVQLSAGMNYQTNGVWMPSRATIQPTAEGAAAVQGHHKVYFSPDIDTSTGAVHLVTGDQKHLRSRILGLSYYDFKADKSVLIAELTNAPGIILGANRVIYTNALTDFRADIRYTYTQAGLEQDVILRERPPLPEDFGLNPSTTRLEVWTEYFNPPTPKIVQGLRRGWKAATVDKFISFGEMQIVQGYLSSLTGSGDERKGVPVEKHWEDIEGRHFLVEEVPFRWVAAQYKTLQKPSHASIDVVPGSVRHVVSSERLLPKVRLAQRSSATNTFTALSNPTLLAQLAQQPGCCIDYIQVTTTNDFRFQSDTTYVIPTNSTVYLSGTTVIEGGTVIKYNPNSAIEIDGDIQCLTGPYRPAFLTAIDDNSVGEPLGNGNPSGTYADTALVLSGNADLKYLNIRYASAAVFSANDFSIKHSQITDCTYGLQVQYCSFYAGNDLFYHVGEDIHGSWFHGVGENLTMHHAVGMLVNDPDFHNTYDVDCSEIPSSTLALTNCYVWGITDDSVVPITTNHVSVSAPFHVGGGGDNYSLDHSDGTTDINPDLLADLRKKTTFPPTVLSNVTISGPTNLSPQVPRDNGTGVGIGYHYDPIDYEFGDIIYSNAAPLTISPGTVIATFGLPGDHFGLLSTQSPIMSTGTPGNPVWITTYKTVQENTPPNWGFNDDSMISADNSEFKFTRWSCPARDAWFVSGFLNAPAGFRDCQFYGGFLVSEAAAVNVTNCLLDGTCTVISSTGSNLQFRNNLFRNGVFAMFPATTTASIKDNLFDRTGIQFTCERIRREL